MKQLFILALLLLSLPLFSQEWQKADRVIATVNTHPVIESHLEMMYDIAVKRSGNSKNLSSKQKQQLINSILDSLINEAILFQVADQESIIISEERIDNHIKDLMKYHGFSDTEKFKKHVEKTEKMPFTLYRNELKKQLTMEQLMVYAMDFVPPSESAAKEWYEKNKANMIQVRFQRILIIPKNDSFAEEKRANELAEELYQKINSGSSFESLARRHSEDRDSARNGGIVGWTSFSEVDPDVAGYVYQMKERRLYPVFKTKKGYNVIRYFGTRSMPYEEIRDRIFQMIAQQARQEQFLQWVTEKREQCDVQIYLEGYEYKNPLKAGDERDNNE